MPLLLSTVADAIYSLEFTEAQLNTVLEVHRYAQAHLSYSGACCRKGLQSCAAEPLRNQSKYLLNALLSQRVWTREQRLGAMEGITLAEVLGPDSFSSCYSCSCRWCSFPRVSWTATAWRPSTMGTSARHRWGGAAGAGVGKVRGRGGQAA